jgi:predicted unusual protein kinase regulating ubiquinone biosynthesis (AarF/ABC1/UbiB family)
MTTPYVKSGRWSRNARLAGLGARIGLGHAGSAARKVFASAERRVDIDRERELRTAAQIADRLGQLKGALMKIGQMASYLDDGLPEPLRAALTELQSNAPPMSADLAAGVIRAELGAHPEDIFIAWDPDPIAAASIGQVHRAIVADPTTGDHRAVAVKVQYPGVAEAIEADLANADLLGFVLAKGFPGLDPSEMVAEIKERIVEELDYRREAANQRIFAENYQDHPFLHVPEVLDEFSTNRVLTSELVVGHSWSEVLDWNQPERDRAAEALFRFVFRSLYGLAAFNGDPHPGNYVFHRDGRLTLLDFGLVKHFAPREMEVFLAMVRSAVVERDAGRFREVVETAGLLRRNAPVTTEAVGEYFSHFYEPVRIDAEMAWTPEYASRIVRHTFDRSSPIAPYATVPRAFVFIQRINLGLYALLGQLRARGNYRRISEEIWPFMQAPPSTPLGEAEAAWAADRARR